MDKLTETKVIEKYLGVPYLHKGRDLTGLDCWGLIILIYKDLGIDIFDLDNYEKNWHLKGDNHFIENYYDAWIKHLAPIFKDILLFNSSKNITNHAGLYLSNGKFLHGCKAGVVVGRLNGKWEERLQGIYRYKNGSD